MKSLNHFYNKNYNFLWKSKHQEIEINRARVDIEELKKRLRIVVIDDEDSFPVKLFQEAGYSIDKWDKVKLQ
ncbi:MAG: hypothetical protein IPO32_04835 [Crocinitomicaceae bacterium]|nr:hypothetical protein [Crocinitomicaceae bacterium]